jgi:deoxyribonucleoside regulator
VEEKTRAEISESLGLSYATISRLLKRAKEEGIIEFHITEPYLTCNRMEEEIMKKYGLKSAIVVPVAEEDGETVKKQVALEGARYVQRIIKDGDVVGLNWGGTMYHLIQYLNPCRKVNASIVTMHGSIASCNPNLEVKSLVHRAAMAFGGRNVSLMAPGLYASKNEVDKLKGNPECQEIFSLFEKIDISVSGVGSLYPKCDSLLGRASYLTEDEFKILEQEGVYSDILLRFIDKNGNECNTSLKDRTLAIELGTYKKIPCKIVVASGSQKAESVSAILNGKLVDVLIVDYQLAKAVMELST